MPSPLKLDRYFIDEISVVTNKAYERDSAEPEPGLRTKAIHRVHKEDPTAHQLEVIIKTVSSKGSEHAFPYRLAIKGRAFFRVTDPTMEPVRQRRLALLNGGAMLVGLMRAHLAQATALGEHGPAILQPLNLFEAFNIPQSPGRKRRSLSADSSSLATQSEARKRTAAGPQSRGEEK